jgi:hypothetical protein
VALFCLAALCVLLGRDQFFEFGTVYFEQNSKARFRRLREGRLSRLSTTSGSIDRGENRPQARVCRPRPEPIHARTRGIAIRTRDAAMTSSENGHFLPFIFSHRCGTLRIELDWPA